MGLTVRTMRKAEVDCVKDWRAEVISGREVLNLDSREVMSDGIDSGDEWGSQKVEG